MKHPHRDRARDLRREATDAERRLWSRLRRNQLELYGFRRQAPIGSFIVDFVCYEARLIVEVDGGQHATERAEYDAHRTAWLEARGFQVLRFWNQEVLRNTDGILETILFALRQRSRHRT